MPAAPHMAPVLLVYMVVPLSQGHTLSSPCDGGRDVEPVVAGMPSGWGGTQKLLASGCPGQHDGGRHPEHPFLNSELVGCEPVPSAPEATLWTWPISFLSSLLSI